MTHIGLHILVMVKVSHHANEGKDCPRQDCDPTGTTFDINNTILNGNVFSVLFYVKNVKGYVQNLILIVVAQALQVQILMH
jgi:hypothetical protein